MSGQPRGGAAGGGIRDDSGTHPSSVRFGQRPSVVLQSGRARADVPPSIVEAIRMGRMTALRKTNGGVRGIVVGDVVRRLVARTVAQQLGPSVEAATAPYQYVLSTRAGSECIAHVIQGLTELNPEATVLSIDGISAHDQISRAAMMDGLFSLCGGEAVPFVRLFYGSPSTYMWEDAEGVEHLIPQGEGGEQGDPMMPLLYHWVSIPLWKPPR